MFLNPFSTRFTSPLDCRPVSASGFDWNSEIAELADNFVKSSCCGQIIGPHGCGKSVLAGAISQISGRRFTETRFVNLRARRSWMPFIRDLDVTSDVSVCRSGSDPDARCGRTLIVVDGIECLSATTQRLSMAAATQANCGMLITSHRRIPHVPVIAALKPDPRHFQDIVRSLQENSPAKLSAKQVSNAYRRFNGDYRKSLRYLYDVYSAE